MRRYCNCFSILVIFILMLTLLPVSVLATDPVSAWDGNVATGFAGGSGTQSDPYQIQTAAQLAYLAQSVNNGISYRNQYISLEADLDLMERNWTPIGKSELSNSFRGTFLGKNHRISNLYINTASSDIQGLFGRAYGATIQGLRLENVFVYGKKNIGGLVGQMEGTIQKCSVTGEVRGNENVGGIAGYHYNGSVIECDNHAKVSGTGNYVGGVVGHVLKDGFITNCVNNGIIDTSGIAGGVIGGSTTTTTVIDCFNSGAVSGTQVGGIACEATTVVNCGNIGRIQGSSETGGIVCKMVNGTMTYCWNGGTIAGQNGGNLASYALSSSLAYCYWPTGSSAMYRAPTTGYENTLEELISVSADCMKTTHFVKILNDNIDPRVNKYWSQASDMFGGYPYLEFRNIIGISVTGQPDQSVFYEKLPFSAEGMVVTAIFDDGSTSSVNSYTIVPSGGLSISGAYVTVCYDEFTIRVPITVLSLPISGSGTEASPYIVDSGLSLSLVAKLCLFEETRDNFLAAYYRQMADIAVDTKAWIPIGAGASMPFSGTYDGNGYSISGIEMDGSENELDMPCGLFGLVTGIVKNVTLEASRFQNGRIVGGIVGIIKNGKVENCITKGISVASTEDKSVVGGIVGAGLEHGVISRCSSDGTASGCYCGGIVGNASGVEITNSINWSNVTALSSFSGAFAGGIAAGMDDKGVIQSCFNFGDVTAGGQKQVPGGICAVITSGEIQECANYASIKGMQYTGGICGLAQAENSAEDVAIDTCGNYGKITSLGTTVSSYVGGICGSQNTAVVRNCINCGNITVTGSSGGGITGFSMEKSVIDNCANIADITCSYTSAVMGGIVGRIGNSTICSSYNAGNIENSSYSGAITGQVSNCTTIACYSNSQYSSDAMRDNSFCGIMNSANSSSAENQWVQNDQICNGYAVPGEWHLQNHGARMLLILASEVDEMAIMDVYTVQDIPEARIICSAYGVGQQISVNVDKAPARSQKLQLICEKAYVDEVKCFLVNADYAPIAECYIYPMSDNKNG